MSDLTFTEKRRLEKLLEMGGGYVLDFSNRTFMEFVADSTGLNIWDARYSYSSGSKANRLRAFWNKEPNHIVGKLLKDMIDYCRPASGSPDPDGEFEQCERIARRLLQGAPVEALDAIAPAANDRGFEILARAVRDSIEKNEPEAGLDRLHTYLTKLVRTFAAKRGVVTEKEKPLHSIFGEYVKLLRTAGLIESEMTERILKASIGTMEAFNRVRNEASLAHDNPTLSYEESLLVFNHVCSAIRFIRALEEQPGALAASAPEEDANDDALPF